MSDGSARCGSPLTNPQRLANSQWPQLLRNSPSSGFHLRAKGWRRSDTPGAPMTLSGDGQCRAEARHDIPRIHIPLRLAVPFEELRWNGGSGLRGFTRMPVLV